MKHFRRAKLLALCAALRRSQPHRDRSSSPGLRGTPAR